MPDTTACPVGFTSGTTGQCVPTCPTTNGLENRIVSGEPRCVYRQDRTKYFALTQSPIVTLNSPTDFAPTVAWLQGNRPALYSAYTSAQTDFETKKALLLAEISTSQQVADAFRELQTAENARGTNPQAYQAARNRYYTLTQGDAWESNERTRLLTAEVIPEITPYLQSINFMTSRQSQQEQTKAAVTAVKSKLMTLKDDFRATTATFMKQVDELRNQIELQKRRSIQVQAQTSDWFVNLILIGLSLVVIYLLYRRITGSSTKTASSSSISKAYTSRAVGP